MRPIQAASLVFAAVLCGCSAVTPPYALAPGVAYATVKNGIDPVLNRNESIDVRLSYRRGQRDEFDALFSMTKATASAPAQTARVAANTPMTFSYFENVSGGRSCRVEVQAQLQEGKSYTLVGGAAFGKGPLPILPARQCRFGIVDDATGAAVSR
jgi:hypothetical protein